MKRQRFPFLISPLQARPPAGPPSLKEILDALAGVAEAQRKTGEQTSRALASLSLIESSLEELTEKAGAEPGSASSAMGATQGADQGWREFYRRLIPILDGIDALRQAVERQGDPSWGRGMEMLSDKLVGVLETHGLLRTAAVGMAFDAFRHESVGAGDSSEVAPGAVAEVVENGWQYRGEILRYAKVIVARGDE
jgi:hypothetical protein